MATATNELSGWGRYPRHATELIVPGGPEQFASSSAAAGRHVARGNGRAYGDAAIGTDATLSTRSLDRMLAFDAATGRLTAEAGVLLSDILATFVPRGFFPPVVPGTKFVTVGGMIAADVHGKNHHRVGGFGGFVERLRLLLPSGEILECSPTLNADAFHATTGGMGLTGTILDATIALNRIETGWLVQTTTIAPNLAAAIAVLDRSHDATYSVAWIDCLARGDALGRSLVFTAEHATRSDLDRLGPGRPPFPPAGRQRARMPFDFPAWALNSRSVRLFNEVYFRRNSHGAGQPRLVPWDPYFFPLDGIGDWNRMYGARGFLQHQCVVPPGAAEAVLGTIIARVSHLASASFLAVLKKFGPAGPGYLSFPIEGLTLAIDVPVQDGLTGILDEIDRAVVGAGGRLYLAKDARQSPETLAAGYARLPEFREVRRRLGATGRLESRLSRRLAI